MKKSFENPEIYSAKLDETDVIMDSLAKTNPVSLKKTVDTAEPSDGIWMGCAEGWL